MIAVEHTLIEDNPNTFCDSRDQMLDLRTVADGHLAGKHLDQLRVYLIIASLIGFSEPFKLFCSGFDDNSNGSR